MSCTVPHCGRPAHSRTWCRKHYKRWAAHGDPAATAKPRHKTAADHFRHYMPGPPPPPTLCWIWQGTVNANSGYGYLTHRRRSYRASRVAYELFVGPIPDGNLIRHTCDNPPCVNPAHLLVGTYLDNSRDAVGRGRTGGGGAPKLTAEKVRSIRQTYAAGGVTQSSLARTHGVTLGTIEHIMARRTWVGVE